jgi:hypothetical protein
LQTPHLNAKLNNVGGQSIELVAQIQDVFAVDGGRTHAELHQVAEGGVQVTNQRAGDVQVDHRHYDYSGIYAPTEVAQYLAASMPSVSQPYPKRGDVPDSRRPTAPARVTRLVETPRSTPDDL